PPRSDQYRHSTRTNISRTIPVTAAAANISTPTTSGSSLVSSSDIESFLKQLLSVSGNTSAALSTPPGNTKWYFDSDCFNYMSPMRESFSSISHITSAPPVHTADGSLMHVHHKGSVSTSSLHLPDTFFIPKLNFNLISVGQLVELGFDVNFSASGCHVQDSRTGRIIGTGCKVERLFELNNLHIPSVPNICAVSSPS
ncbi:hypothetical protein PIB30_108716, partial [Stylosanthes scabra]|nr:hypothetical protein [Stylosanthes scabra]